ncbi:MAG TPA: hypothetical protein VFU02_12530 [Polyangiaceae bacterium]|nr:hypothetical protein [Polyangiaceae bacterium]
MTAATTRHVLGWLAGDGSRHGPPNVPVLAISGAQGAGKTTLLRELPRRLFDAAGYRVAALSLDDFYLTRRERLALGRQVHPLFVTRGVPGTHDLVLLENVLDDLRSGRGATIPHFDKALDDRAEAGAWTRIEAGSLDLIVIEGWCLGLPPEPESALVEPINELERLEDPAGVWRREVNRALATSYRQLFTSFDWVVALLAPSFEAVYDWRYQQEQALAASLGASDSRQKLLTEPAELRRFLAHFERLTRHAFRCLPNLAQLLLKLDEARRVVHVVHLVSGETPGSRSPDQQ